MEKLGQLRAEAEREGTLGPHRRRHPAVALGAGLPRRPQAARVVPRRPVHPAAHRPRPRPAAAPTSRSSASGVDLVTQHAVQGARRPAARRTCRPSSPRSTRCSAGSASAPTSDLRAAQGARRRRSSSSPRPSATRCARRPTSSTGSTRRVCRSPGVVVNRIQRVAAPALSGRTRRGRRRAAGRRRRPVRRPPADPGRCCACTPTWPRRPPGRTRLARAVRGRRTPASRSSRCRPRRRTSTTSTGCARSAPRSPPADRPARRPREADLVTPGRRGSRVTAGGGRHLGDGVWSRSGDSSPCRATGCAPSEQGGPGGDVGAARAGPGARARSSHPRHRTRCGCRGRRRGTRRRPGSPGRPPWRRCWALPWTNSASGSVPSSEPSAAQSDDPTDRLWRYRRCGAMRHVQLPPDTG